MKITAVTPFLIHPLPPTGGWRVSKHLLLVKVETDDGITGWGEAFTLRDRELSLAQNVVNLRRYLLGKDPFRIKAFVQWACNVFSDGRPALELFSAVSGIEQALWDIVGKALATPVYNLLGGACRDRIRVYANGWTAGARSAKEMAERAAGLVRMGFTAIKFYPFENDEPEKVVIENIQAVQEAVGPEIDLLIDVWRRPDPCTVVRVARAIQDLGIFWYEEPVPSENLDLLAEVRRSIPFRVVTGECLYSKFDFRQVLEKRAADILNPDVASCGGILQLKEIGAMAEPYYVQMSPHNYNSTAVGLAATLQVSAVIPNFVITEYFVNFRATGDAISVHPLEVQDGTIALPAGPGLGIEIDEAALREHGYREFPQRAW